MSAKNIRMHSIQQIIKQKKIEGIIIANIKNVRYLTGFRGSSGFIFITRDKRLFFTDFRYKEQAQKEVNGWEIGIEKGKRIDVIRNIIKKIGIKSLGFEASISYEFYEHLKRLPVRLIPLKGIIENLRKIKDKGEIFNIKKAVEIAEKAFLKVRPMIRAGVKENEIASRLEDELKRAGCKHIPFDVIVASGKNSSMPHARPTEKKIEKGDFVIIDWGGEADGYYSDMTRTFLINGASISDKIKIYKLVQKAQQRAIDAVGLGIKTQDIDRIARDIIKKAGYGEFFGHGTGHGIGLDVHEPPYVSWFKGERISDGMVFTVEPGVYMPGKGGVRIEDMVLVKNGKAELLTGLSRDLEIIR